MGRNLGEHWDGISWSVMTPPDVPGRNDGLWAVSCLSASDCWTVGGSNDFVTQHALAEHWNGRAWRIVPTPHFASENDGFQGLTCLSTSDCWAVGSGTQRSAVAEHWNGGAWSVSPTPAPNASEQNQLTAVDCTSTSDCWAVGAAVAANTPRSPSRTLAEHDTLAPSPLLIPGGGSVVEGNSGSAVLKVPVTLSNAFPQTVTVEWTTYPIAGVGRADSGIDYAPASGTVTFAPGQTTKEVAVAVLGDTLVEPDEWLAVSFTHATNATIGGFYGLGFGEIVNDDGP
jgi:hypothetical protein